MTGQGGMMGRGMMGQGGMMGHGMMGKNFRRYAHHLCSDG